MKGNNKDLKIAVMATNIEFIKGEVIEVKDEIKTLKLGFVSRSEFEPVKKITYGLVTILLTIFISAIAYASLRG